MSLRLILADDHQLVREALRALLEKEADLTIVGEAADGRALLQLAAELQPDMVIIDISMPDMDGIAATRRLHADYPSIKVIALSMFCNPQYTLEILAAGASAYVTKASAGEHLLLAIHEVAANKRYLSPKIAAVLAGDSVHAKATDYVSNLDRRELDVMKLLVEGLTPSEIADRLQLSELTVETDQRNILQKLNCNNLADLIKYAILHGLTFF